MRRADRLFAIVQALRGGRMRTARQLAELLEVSPRTVYRDVQDLIGSGVPVEGEAGVGYVLRPGHLLPPLSFTAEELQALAFGARMVEAWTDPALAAAAAEALVKLRAVVPPAQDAALRAAPLTSYAPRMTSAERARLGVLRRAVGARRKLRLRYARPGGPAEERLIRPLSVEFWGHAWTLTAWCELRQDFRVFRLDRVLGGEMQADGFRPERGRELADYLRQLAPLP